MRTWLMDEGSEIPAVLYTLKNLFKAKGLLYHDIAETLGTSETSVKRYLTGHNVTLETLEALCRIVGLRLSDVIEMAQEETEWSVLSLEEEQFLATEPFLAALFYMLSQGLTPAILQRDFGIGDAEMNDYLGTLDRLGLIKLFPYNRIKLRVSRNFNVQQGGPLMRLAYETLLKDFFENFEIDNPDWSFTYAKLSDSSLERVRELVRNFVIAFERIADADRELPSDIAKWYGFLSMLRPVDIGGLRSRSALNHANKEKGQAA